MSFARKHPVPQCITIDLRSTAQYNSFKVHVWALLCPITEVHSVSGCRGTHMCACYDACEHLKPAWEFCPACVVVSAPDFHVGSRGFDPWVCVTVSV